MNDLVLLKYINSLNLSIKCNLLTNVQINIVLIFLGGSALRTCVVKISGAKYFDERVNFLILLLNIFGFEWIAIIKVKQYLWNDFRNKKEAKV